MSRAAASQNKKIGKRYNMADAFAAICDASLEWGL